MTGSPHARLVLKIGGNQLDDAAFVAGMARMVRQMLTEGKAPPVIVHGGGKAIKTLQEKFGIQPRQIGGLRVTDDQTMQLVLMALLGQANVNLVAALAAAGVEAQGFSGADRALLRSQPLHHPEGELGRVGQITQVRHAVLLEALAAGVVPVIAPVALAADGGFHNVNADQAAGAVASALAAQQVVFLTDVPGVLHEGQRLPRMALHDAERLLADGVARDGMAVKLRAALDALRAGVQRVMITNLEGLALGEGTIVA